MPAPDGAIETGRRLRAFAGTEEVFDMEKSSNQSEELPAMAAERCSDDVEDQAGGPRPGSGPVMAARSARLKCSKTKETLTVCAAGAKAAKGSMPRSTVAGQPNSTGRRCHMHACRREQECPVRYSGCAAGHGKAGFPRPKRAMAAAPATWAPTRQAPTSS